jgi:protein tyrosine/serine phosphatase
MAQFADSQPAPVAAKGKRRRLRVAEVVFLCVVLLIALFWYIGVFGGNVRVVVPGKVYRSAQLTGNNYTADTAAWVGEDLDAVLKRYGIRTVINLRGGRRSNDYYRQEIEECVRRGVEHVDVPMSATHLPPPQSLTLLLNAFDRDPYPVLFHCQGGADRSGLVGTLYLNLYQHVSLDQAEERQLTPRYGHLAFTRTGAMDRFFELYRRESHGMDLRTWILKEYPAVYARETGSNGSSPQK